MSDEANAAGTAQAETTPWYPEEQKTLVETKGWKEPKDVLKSYSELEKSMGSRVKLPSEKSTPEEIKEFHKKLGVPEKPDGYEIQLDESLAKIRDENAEKVIKQIAHQHGVPKQAFEALATAYYKDIADRMQKSFEEGSAKLKEELGDKYDESIKVAQRFTQNCSEPFRQFLETSGLGNNPLVIKEFIALGKKTLSDSLIKGDLTDGKKSDYVPQYVNSPSMYATMEGEEGEKARAYFIARGHKY